MGHCPAPAGRLRFDIADIVREHRAALEQERWLSPTEKRVLTAIARCRTASLGGHVEVCRSCGHQQPAYNSCRNRHCPKCQCLAQEKVDCCALGAAVARASLSSGLYGAERVACALSPGTAALFEALFHSASETLLQLGRERLGATLGVTMVLHTWTRGLRFHPHVHAIVTAGGVAASGEWHSTKNFLFHVDVMGALLRCKMMEQLRRLERARLLHPTRELQDPQAFDRLLTRLAQVRWVVYAKRPFRQIEHVLAYLGRYTHRVAISNGRLLEVTASSVTFRTKEGKAHSITPVEFLRRFLFHVLPEGFHKTRHYGLYAELLGSRARAGSFNSPFRGRTPVPRHELPEPSCSSSAKRSELGRPRSRGNTTVRTMLSREEAGRREGVQFFLRSETLSLGQFSASDNVVRTGALSTKQASP